jgi:AcrR family transcriptional regulator
MTLHRDTIPPVAAENDAERKKIVAAMRRLLITGKPRVVAPENRLVIDTLCREAGVTRSALTHRHIDLKDLFLDCVAERQQETRDLRPANEIALEKQLDELKARNRDLQTRATHWEGAARDLARTVAALQMPYTTASARLDAIISDTALDNLAPNVGPNVSPPDDRRRK